ncbi:GGDEF domain-containing protein [Arcobacter sp. FWKO B]|uniref:GGDEF domain-containing protein n=1 Tax=Arcobacter sp. FWKO B TaxID=2593672 RepID=UPI0018A405A1|nr:GGDEF domain-containing protein [Arcobacter sp. FWKO B]QOG12736.1 GGDEF domain-containing protein [Arcobacter sp. FWKO B]
MIKEVEVFLKETKISYKQFDRLLDFFYFKDIISHKQSFNDVCREIECFFSQNFHMSSMKIMSYDIEVGSQHILYSCGDFFNENFDLQVFKFDFSKSYELNGRLYFKTIDDASYKKVQEDKTFLNFIFYEMKHILLYYLSMQKLKESALIDPITSLPNRKFLVRHLSSVLEIAKKENIQIALLKVDIDRFKAVIEEFDYDISNKVLQKLSKVLVKNISSTDIVTIFEDNSFLICVQDMKKECDIIYLVQKCINDFAKEYVIVNQHTGQKLFKTICVGMSIYPRDGEYLDKLIKHCDIALDEAKNKGRSSYSFFHEEQNCVIDLF